MRRTQRSSRTACTSESLRKARFASGSSGLVLGAKVLPADVHDQQGGRELLEEAHEQIPSLRHLFADSSYRGKWAHRAKEAMSVSVEIVRRPDANVRAIWWPKDQPLPEEYIKLFRGHRGFMVIPRRRVVERSFAWLGRHRRMSKDYERQPATTESLIFATMMRLLLRRLARVP